MRSYLITYGQTIFDLVNKFYGGAEFVYKLIQENPFITSIDYDFNANPGQTIFYDETFKKPKSKTVQATQSANNNIGKIKSTDGQSIYDLCIQSGQPLEKLLEFIQDNEIVNLNTNDFGGKEFTFNKEKIKDVLFYKNLVAKKIQINTGNFAKGNKRYLITTSGARIITSLNQQITI